MADQTESHITISSDPATIMAVIADLSTYPEWTGGVRATEVLTEYDDGRPGDARISLESGPIKDTYTLGYEWDGDNSVVWQITEPGTMVTGMDGVYELIDNGDGTTTVIYRLAVKVNLPMLGMMKRKAEKVITDSALKGLKKRVEG